MKILSFNFLDWKEDDMKKTKMRLFVCRYVCKGKKDINVINKILNFFYHTVFYHKNIKLFLL